MTGSRRSEAADTDHQAGATEEKQRDERAPLSEAVGAVGGQIDLGLLAGDAGSDQPTGDCPERQAKMLVAEGIEHIPAVRGSTNDGQ